MALTDTDADPMAEEIAWEAVVDALRRELTEATYHTLARVLHVSLV